MQRVWPILVVAAVVAACSAPDKGEPVVDVAAGDSKDLLMDDTEGPADLQLPDAADALNEVAQDVLTPPDTADVVCIPDCAGRECGEDGCGGQCGKCPMAAPICNEGRCEVKCEPSCQDKECGDDGCGGSCGNCPGAAPFCVQGMCAVSCDADCTGKNCGDDGCGNSCGSCEPGWDCVEGKCSCEPVCLDRECGADGCGGSCGTCPQTAPFCVQGYCEAECTPKCTGKQCGDDGCGGNCGACPTPAHECIQGICVCKPQCADGACGDDGCGGSCPACDCGHECIEGFCQFTACAGKHCGADGCGGTCGTCPPGFSCGPDQTCMSSCDLACQGKECGASGCGGLCGTCPPGEQCNDFGLCVAQCIPNCSGKVCGPNGCGGLCGTCSPAAPFCDQGACKTQCIPQCGSKVCGPDGCGGSCGTCSEPLTCTLAGTCGSLCASCGYYPECYDITFASGDLAKWTIDGAQLLTAFGQTLAPTGDRMLMLTTGNGENRIDTDSATATFQNCLPPGSYMAVITWKLISEEFREFCGSNFQDSFELELVPFAGGISKKSYGIDSLCGPEDCTGCGSEYQELIQSDVALDQGDAWATNWREDSLPFTLTGQESRFSLTLSAKDAGDSIYDTVVLIDRIRFIPCAAACETLECGPNPCGEQCGTCPVGSTCISGTCCKPQCTGKECGNDGCGGSCGACGSLSMCVGGVCQCKNTTCSDGCCEAWEVCGVASGKCCMPTCNQPCAADGCGGKCPGTGGATCCTTVADCNDNNPCTIDTCSMGQCNHAPSGGPGCCTPFAWSENFDDGVADNFTFVSSDQGFPGLGASWNTTNLCGSHSPDYALHFGMANSLFGTVCAYTTEGFPMPIPASGSATTPAIQLPAQPTLLKFWVYPDILGTADMDRLDVSIVSDMGSSTSVWSKANLQGGVGTYWTEVTIDLSSYAGQSINVRFSFDSLGSLDATKTGPKFDDVRIMGLCP